MLRLSLIGVLLVSACGGGSPRRGPEPKTPEPGAEETGPASHTVDCLPRLDGTKIQARLAKGYTLRELVLWYGAVTCEAVLAPRPLLSRRAPGELDEVVPADEVAELFREAVAGLGLATVRRGDLIVVVDGADEPILFTPRHVGEPEGEAEERGEGAAPVTGIAACDAYVRAMEAYIACDKLPEQAQQAMQESLEQMKESWSELDEESEEMATRGCEQGLEALEQASRSIGCGGSP